MLVLWVLISQGKNEEESVIVILYLSIKRISPFISIPFMVFIVDRGNGCCLKMGTKISLSSLEVGTQNLKFPVLE